MSQNNFNLELFIKNSEVISESVQYISLFNEKLGKAIAGGFTQHGSVIIADGRIYVNIVKYDESIVDFTNEMLATLKAQMKSLF